LNQKQKLEDLIQETEAINVTSDDLNTKINPDTKYFEQSIEAIQQA